MKTLPVVSAKQSVTRALVLMVVGMLYGVSPIDAIPDLIPALGLADDTVVLILCGLGAYKIILRQMRHSRSGY
ncbi:MAG: DUF1232 domain-containing protein [Armatimonadetes bacterium]|nr:DUF1232 domain-containing protein [Armatimonadota bacterium]